jgi:hypothetical protein
MNARTVNHRHGRWSARSGITLLTGLALLLTACGSRLSGQYSDKSGMLQYDFRSDGKVYMSTLGIQTAGEYEIDDDKVILKGSNGNMVLEIQDDGTLTGPMGMVLSKREAGG